MSLEPYIRLLRSNPAFARVYLAQLVSFGGDWFATVALLGLAFELTGSAALTSLVLVLQVGPFFLASPFGGWLADRLNRQRLMVGTDLARAVVALGLLLSRDESTLWIALLCTALLSAGAAFFEPASAAALPNLVDREDLPSANVLIGSAWGTMLVVGAGLGGVFAGVFGRDASFVADAASFLLSALLIVGVRRSFSESGSRPEARHGLGAASSGPLSALTETITLARASRTVAAFLFSKATWGVGSGALLLLAVIAQDVFHGGDLAIGLLYACRGLGALVGPFIGRAVAGPTERGLIITIAGSLVVFNVSYFAIPLAPGLLVAGVLVFLGHLGGGTQWTLSSLGLQRAVPDRVRGRVFSMDYAMVTLTIAISTLASGALAEVLGPAGALQALLGVSTVASLVWAVWTRPLWARSANRPDRPSSEGP